MADTSDDLPRILVPDAVIGRRYSGIPWDGRIWTVLHEQVTHVEGMEAINSTILSQDVGEVCAPSQILMRCVAWDHAPHGIPRIPWPDLQHLLLPGGVIDLGTGCAVLAYMLSEIEVFGIIEYRVTGPDADRILDHIQTAMARANARKPI